jgi:hypothetical protein
MQSMEDHVTKLLSEVEYASKRPKAHPLLLGALQILQELKRELAVGEVSPERRKSYAYGIYRTVIDDSVFAESEIGQELMKLSDELDAN